jgi:hypothetical protein
VTFNPALHLLVVGHAGGHENAARSHVLCQLQGVSTFSAAAAAEDENFGAISHVVFLVCFQKNVVSKIANTKQQISKKCQSSILTVSQKVIKHVIPAKAGIDNYLKTMDSRLRGNDINGPSSTFCDFINIQPSKGNSRAFGKLGFI